MMALRRFTFGLVVSVSLLMVGTISVHAESEDKGCPRIIATVGESVMAGVSEEILKKIYKDLGCSIKLEAYPGLRAIAWFNNGSVDGEMYRLKIAEKRYSRKFVRSSQPLFHVYGSLWGHPDREMKERLPIGYVQGIVWEEKYMEGRRGKKYDSVEDAFEAYELGEIGSFLSNDFSVLHKMAQGIFSAQPVRGERILISPLYHYLGIEYSAFMERFSQYLAEKAPFNTLEFYTNEDKVN